MLFRLPYIEYNFHPVVTFSFFLFRFHTIAALIVKPEVDDIKY